MEKYETKLYEYLTDPANYKCAKELVSKLNDIDRRLRSEFWIEGVYQKLKKIEAVENNFGFIVERKEDKTGFSQIRITKSNWQGLSVCFEAKGSFEDTSERVYWAIQIDWDVHNKDIVKEISSINSENIPALSFDQRWLGWEYIDHDFEKFEDLLRISPERREILAEELALLLWKKAEEYQNCCDEIGNSGRNTQNLS